MTKCPKTVSGKHILRETLLFLSYGLSERINKCIACDVYDELKKKRNTVKRLKVKN